MKIKRTRLLEENICLLRSLNNKIRLFFDDFVMENERVILLSEITSENMQTREWNVGSNLTERESECKSKITYFQIFIDSSISKLCQDK